MDATAVEEENFATLRDLLAALGYDCSGEDEIESAIEGYADEYMVEDLGMNLFVALEGDEILSLRGSMSFYTDDAVRMWDLECPVTVGEFHSYLDEFDLRVARLRAIVDLPQEVADDVEEPVSITETLARLFQADQAEVVDQLGEDWQPLASDVMGVASQPNRYLLWRNRIVLGLDDENAHLFLPIFSGDTVRVGDVITYVELGEHTTVSVSQLSEVLGTALKLPEGPDLVRPYRVYPVRS